MNAYIFITTYNVDIFLSTTYREIVTVKVSSKTKSSNEYLKYANNFTYSWRNSCYWQIIFYWTYIVIVFRIQNAYIFQFSNIEYKRMYNNILVVSHLTYSFVINGWIFKSSCNHEHWDQMLHVWTRIVCVLFIFSFCSIRVRVRSHSDIH
jgi:hypothetical protein